MRLDKDQKSISEDASIIVATESIFKHTFTLPGEPVKQREKSETFANLELVAVIWPDMVLNRPDFRAAEKLFSLLLQLSCLTDNFLIIQTNFPQHYCFQALIEKQIDQFYQTELTFRRQSKLPPFTHVIMVKLRGKNKDKLGQVAEELFNILNNKNKDRTIKIDSHSAQIPPKRRDKFYEQILIKTKSVTKAVSFLKKTLCDFRRWGIIITVDVDPV